MERTALGFTPRTELVGLCLQLQAEYNAEILPQYTTGLHAWFLAQVRQTNPELSQDLHDEQSEKAFTLSRLEGVSLDTGTKIRISAHQVYQWTITALNLSVAQWLRQWLNNPPSSLQLYDVKFNILSITIIHPATTYQELLQTPVGKTLALSFLSPTSFRRKKHHFPLPLPFNVFQSYLRRWNDFADYVIETESFLEWVDENVIIVRHQIHTVKVTAGKRGSVTGFLGAVEYGLTTQGQKNAEFVQFLFALAKLAPYSGTGHKTPFGLGQTRNGWLLNEDIFKVSSPEILLAQRIEKLTEILMSQQKRTGGERALNISQTRATILARQEFGESLKDIAQDLEIPYETVKTYAKLTRKLLK